MGKLRLVRYVVVVCFCFMFAGVSIAADKSEDQNKKPKLSGIVKDSPSKNKGAEQNKIHNGMHTNCPECAAFIAQINAKKGELKAIKDKIKAIREAGKSQREAERSKKEAERQAKLEEMKKNNPEKYAEVIAKMEARKKEMGEKKKQHIENPNKGPKDKSGKFGNMKNSNPELAALLAQMQTIHSDIKTLHQQIRDCKKDDNNKDKK